MSLDRIHSSARTTSSQGWTVVYRDDCVDLTSTQVDYDPPDSATDGEIVEAVSDLLCVRRGEFEVPEVLFIFRGRHADLIGDERRQD